MRLSATAGLVLLLALALVALAGGSAASATVLCEANESPCLGKRWYQLAPVISGKAKTPSMVTSSFSEKCTQSTLLGEVTEEPTESKGSLIGKITKMTFAECSTPCKAVQATHLPYKTVLTATKGGGGPLTVESSGAGVPQLKLSECSFGSSCAYGVTKFGQQFSGGSPASIASESVSLKLEEGTKAQCGETLSLTSTVAIETPAAVYASSAPKLATLCSVETEEVEGQLVCPKGKEYEGKIKVELDEESEVTFESTEGPAGTVSCEESTMAGEFKSNGKATSKSGGITSISMNDKGSSNCASTFAEAAEAKVEWLQQPYFRSTFSYEQPGPPLGTMSVTNVPGIPGNFIRVNFIPSPPGMSWDCYYSPLNGVLDGQLVQMTTTQFVFTNQIFVLQPGNDARCAGRSQFSGRYDVTTGSGGIVTVGRPLP